MKRFGDKHQSRDCICMRTDLLNFQLFKSTTERFHAIFNNQMVPPELQTSSMFCWIWPFDSAIEIHLTKIHITSETPHTSPPHTDRQVRRQKNGWLDGWMDGWTDKHPDKHTSAHYLLASAEERVSAADLLPPSFLWM